MSNQKGASPTYQGKFAGVIVDTNDPEKRGRVKVAVPDLYTDPTSGKTPGVWCEGAGSFGVEAGGFSIPPVGAPVWVSPRFSEDNQIYQLIWEKGRHGASFDEASQSKVSNVPAVARGVDDVSCGPLKGIGKYPVVSANQVAGASEDFDIPENEVPGLPPTPNAGIYPEGHSFKTPGGILLEADDTPGAQRVHIWMPSGVYIEIDDSGAKVERVTQSTQEVVNNDTKFVGGDAKTSILGGEAKRVQGNSVEDTRGRKVMRANQMSLQARRKMHLDAQGSMEITSRGTGTYKHSNGRSVVSGGTDSVSGLEAERLFATSYKVVAGTDATIAAGGIVSVAAGGLINLTSPLGVNVGLAPLVPGLPVAIAANVQAALVAMAASMAAAAQAGATAAVGEPSAVAGFEALSAGFTALGLEIAGLMAAAYATALRTL